MKAAAMLVLLSSLRGEAWWVAPNGRWIAVGEGSRISLNQHLITGAGAHLVVMRVLTPSGAGGIRGTDLELKIVGRTYPIQSNGQSHLVTAEGFVIALDTEHNRRMLVEPEADDPIHIDPFGRIDQDRPHTSQ